MHKPTPVHRRRAGALAALPLLFSALAATIPSGVFAAPPPAPTSHQITAGPINGTIAPGVHVGDIDLSGLDEAAARHVLDQAFARVSLGKVSISAGARTIDISYADINRHVDIDQLIADAFSVGRTGSSFNQMIQFMKVLASGQSLTPRIVFDEVALRQRMIDGAIAARQVFVNARAIRTKTGFSAEPGKDGLDFDATAAVAGTIAALYDPNAPSELKLTLVGAATPPMISDAQAQAAATAATAMSLPIVLASGGQSWTIPQNVVHSWISFKVLNGTTITIVLSNLLIVKHLTKIAPQINRAPVSASWRYSPNGVVVEPAKDGRAVDIARTARRLEVFLQGRADGTIPLDKKIGPTVSATKAEFTTEEAQASASKFKLLSTWTTYFQPAEKNGFGANIWVPAGYLDNQTVMPGETFSFWDRVGEVSLARGYKMGGAIVGGHTQYGVALAGGICSTSTTLFNAALRAGMKIVERSNHYYYINRYPVGLDATVSKTSGGGEQDLVWTNNSAYPVLIKSFKTGGSVTFSLYGIPDGRTVTLTKPIIKNYTKASSELIPVSTLPTGRVVRIEYPADGYQAWVTRYVRDKNGRLIDEKTFFSNYGTVTGVQYIGNPNGRPLSVPSYAPGAQR